MLNTKLLGSVSSAPAIYPEDVFSTYLYTGNGSTQTITNGIDLAGEGGLVWIKDRNSGAKGHALFDTVRGGDYKLQSQSTTNASSVSQQITSFNSNGFTLGTNSDINSSPTLFCSWTFREAPKFFDVVTYTGNGTAGRTVSHNLGSAPGMIIIKCTSNATLWAVYHTSLGNTKYLRLNGTNAAATDLYTWNNTSPTSSVFTVGDAESVNQSGYTYVAYLFAHDAGGFGAAGTDNVISCGSFTGTATAGNAINLGFEPQWIMIKQASGSDAGTNSWSIYDTMRGMPNGSADDNRLEANNSNAEVGYPEIAPTATGFVCEATGGRLNASGGTYIYMAIRRPMKPPTSGTEVFSPIAANNATGTKNTTGFAVDMQIATYRSGSSSHYVTDRLRGVSTTTTAGERYLITDGTGAEVSSNSLTRFWDNTGFQTASGNASYDEIYHNFRRATGFMDVVCWTGDGITPRAINHNLAVSPELVISKGRSAGSNWFVYYSFTSTAFKYVNLNSASGATSRLYTDVAEGLSSQPTSTVLNVDDSGRTNGSGNTYVAYLFASVTGVSKVGTYTGNGSSQTINCGFTAGARFVLIKRTDASGDWVTLDTARGIVSGNDPFLQLNRIDAEVTGEDIVDPDNSGFIVNSTTENINASGGTYIYLAIA